MKDKVVVITGATKGMGFASAKKMLELGAKVVLIYQSDDKRAKECKTLLKDYAKNLIFLKYDIADLGSHKEIVKKTLEAFNEIHVLVNCAGIIGKKSFLKMAEKDFDEVIAINLKAPLFLAQEVAQQMIKQKKGGSIINFSSISGHRGTGSPSYDCAKAGLIIGTQTLANKLGAYGIRVNSISPGIHKTEMNRYAWEKNSEIFQKMIKVTALKRASEASEIAGTLIYLASNASSYVTGTDIIVDGGFLSHCPGRD